MARVVASARSAVTDPLKHSRPLGAVLAMLGVARCVPLLHGAQGCSAFAKALLTRHFREPIPVRSTALTGVTPVLGATDSLLASLSSITRRYRPAAIGVITTGMIEISGEDVARSIGLAARSGEGRRGLREPLIVPISTPDFAGGLSDGWASALDALVTAVLAERGDLPGAGREPDRRLIAAPAGVSLTVADLEEIVGLCEAFGSRVVPLPDLSRSVDGHLGDGWTPLTAGGTTLADLRSLPAAGSVLSIGASATDAGARLAGSLGVDNAAFPHCGGLAATDALVSTLADWSESPVPERVLRGRARMADGLLDTHMVLGGARVAIAGEPEFLATVAACLAEAGATIVAAVSPTPSPVLTEVPCDEVIVGDLLDLEERAGEAGAELVIASSHARWLAQSIGAAHLVAGFPVFDRLGAQLAGFAGYQGGLRLLHEAGNRLIERQSARVAPPRPRDPERRPERTRTGE